MSQTEGIVVYSIHDPKEYLTKDENPSSDQSSQNSLNIEPKPLAVTIHFSNKAMSEILQENLN
jgi:hypothetical protein